MVKGKSIQKTVLEQRPERGGSKSWGKRQRKPPLGKPWGSGALGMFWEKWGGPCGWSRVSTRGRGNGDPGHVQLVGHCKNTDFYSHWDRENFKQKSGFDIIYIKKYITLLKCGWNIIGCTYLKCTIWSFPAGPLVETPPCSIGDMGLTSGLGTKIPHAMEQLSPWTTATEFACRGTCVPQLENLCTSGKDPT